MGEKRLLPHAAAMCIAGLLSFAIFPTEGRSASGDLVAAAGEERPCHEEREI